MSKCKGLPVPHVVGFTQQGTYDRCSGLLGSPGTEVSRGIGVFLMGYTGIR